VTTANKNITAHGYR